MDKEIVVQRYRVARETFRPERVRVLLIAESPPTSGGHFYFEKMIGKDHLFRETMKALGLWPEDKRLSKDFDKAFAGTVSGQGSLPNRHKHRPC